MLGRLFPSPTEPEWCEWQQEPPLARPVFVRIERGPGGRLVLTGLRIDGAPSAELLRAIPVGRIEAAANGQLTVTDDHISANPLPRPGHRPGGSAAEGWTGWDAPAGTPVALRPALRAGRGRPDDFYADVASAYRSLAQSSPRPASDLAQSRGVPVTTAHRWIKEARRRGFLPPGVPGKSG